MSILLAFILWLGGTLYEDGSARLDMGPCALIVPAFDSPGDTIRLSCEG